MQNAKGLWPVKKTVQNGLAYITRDPKAGPVEKGHQKCLTCSVSQNTLYKCGPGKDVSTKNFAK